MVTQSHLYLPLLRRLCARHGVTFERRRLEPRDLEGILECGRYGVVFNCAGLGAKELVGDDSMYPVQGQVVKVKNSPDRPLVFVDSVNDDAIGVAYVIPRMDCTVVGGTAIAGQYGKTPSDQVTRDILARAETLVPGISREEILSVATDMRPARKGSVRQECQVSPGCVLVHSYGFGGCGWTVHLSAARSALALAKDAITKSRGNQKSRL